MTYNVNTYIGEKQVNSEKIVIGQKVVYEISNKYLKNKKENSHNDINNIVNSNNL
ncbi:MAG: hypothetical protein FWF46_04540 [Oscillospiraceae bacterium]|nr:hypothetical protein [Oscillospiraceae bacterium]